ncbi:MAG: hypothetical protein MZU91_01580 [Desulfosudis oleivorans]|nr:hypothetical protein [Desulfosudis oleivorans]
MVVFGQVLDTDHRLVLLERVGRTGLPASMKMSHVTVDARRCSRPFGYRRSDAALSSRRHAAWRRRPGWQTAERRLSRLIRSRTGFSMSRCEAVTRSGCGQRLVSAAIDSACRAYEAVRGAPKEDHTSWVSGETAFSALLLAAAAAVIALWLWALGSDRGRRAAAPAWAPLGRAADGAGQLQPAGRGGRAGRGEHPHGEDAQGRRAGVPRTSSASPGGRENPFNEFFERFFGDEMQREFKQPSLGSGLHHRQGRLRGDQQPRDRGRRPDQGQARR